MNSLIPHGEGTISVRVERTGAAVTYNYNYILRGESHCDGFAIFTDGHRRCSERACSCDGIVNNVSCDVAAVIAEHFCPGEHCGCIEHTGQTCDRCA